MRFKSSAALRRRPFPTLKVTLNNLREHQYWHNEEENQANETK
jgi:hypothetical protein